MSTTDPPPTEEDSVSIISFDDGLYLEGDYALPGSDIRIQHWLSQQCRFALEVNTREKELAAPDNQSRIGPYALGGPGELLSSVLMKQSTSTVSEEAALRADSPLLGFGGKGVEVEEDGDERTLMDPLHFPSATYVRDLPGDSIIKKHSPHSSHSSNTSLSIAATAHARSQSTSSSPRKVSLVLSPLSRRPSLFRQPSLPLLGELDDEQSATNTQVQPQAISVSPPVIPQAGRSRAQSNASISSFHLPTSMQFSLQNTIPAALSSSSPTPPISPPPMARRHSRMPNTPPVSSTLASLSFGLDDDDDVRPLTALIPRPHSQLHGPSHSTNRPPPSSLPPQKIPRALSRSSSTLSLSLLTNNPNNRNAVYIDDIDIKSEDLEDDDDLVAPAADGGEGLGLGVSAVDSPMAEDHRLQGGSGEAGHHTSPVPQSTPPYTSGVYFNAIGSSSQVYLGTASVPASGTSAKKPTRPPPAPPLIIEGEDETGGLGGIGVIDEDAPWSGRSVSADADEERGQLGEESDVIRTESDLDSELHSTDADERGDRLKRFTSRWSLTSSMDENLTSPGASGATANGGGVVSAFGGGGGNGLFGSKKRRSMGGEKEKSVDKEKSIDKEKEREKENKDKSGDKKRGRLVSFISRISSNIASPPASNIPSTPSPSTHDVFEMNTGPASPFPSHSLGFWFSDMVAPPPPILSPTPNVGAEGDGKKEKEKKKKSKEKGKGVVGEELAEKEKGGEKDMKQVDEKEENKENSLPPLPIETVVVVPASIPVHVVADGRADASVSADLTTVQSKATQKSTLLQLKVDTTQQQVPVQLTAKPQFGQISKTVPNHIISGPVISSPLQLTSPSPDPPSQSQYSVHGSSSKGLKHIASPIVKAFSEGFVGAGPAMDFMAVRSGSGSIVVGESGGAMGVSTGRVRSSSAADLLGRSTGGGGGYFDMYQHRQHLYQHQHQTLGQQGQGQGLRQVSERQSQAHSSVTDDYYGSVLGGTSSLRSPTVDGADVTNPRRPGLVKSASTPMLDIGSGGGGYGYAAGIANADLPSSPVLFAAIPDDDDEDDDDDEFDDGEEEEEEEDYGVEAPHGQWRGGGVGLAYDIDREREMGYKRLEIEYEDALRRQQSLEGYSTATTMATPTVTPRVSTDMPPSSFNAPFTRRSGSINNIGVTRTQEQRQLLVQGVDNRQRLRSVTSLGNLSVVGNGEAAAAAALTPTPMMKSGSGSSKGLRGFVERMKFTTATANLSPPSSSSSSPTIPPMVSTTTSSNTSSPSLPHSPTSFVMASSSGGGPPFLNDDRLYGPDNQKKKRKKQPKRKLVINGVSENDVRGYEAVKAWCESFGEVREMKRTPNGHLHVDFRKASVAETVCRLKTQVFIKGAGSVSLSWYTKERLLP